MVKSTAVHVLFFCVNVLTGCPTREWALFPPWLHLSVMAPYSFLSRYTHSNALLSDSKQNGDAAASAAALANEDCPTIDQVLGDERSPATGGLGSNTSRERYPHDRACFLLSAGEFQRTTDGNVRKGRTGQGTGGTTLTTGSLYLFAWLWW